MRHLIPAVFVLAALTACSNDKVTETECQKFAAHFESLMNGGPAASELDKSKQIANQMAPELVRRCLDEGTPEQLRCANAATDMEQLRRCNEKK